MLVERFFSAEPPPIRTKADDNPTLLVSWWCTLFALVIILFRLAGRIIRTERLFREDKIMALAIIPLLVRMGFVHVVLLWGTNNTVTLGLSADNIRHREVGSGLVLMSRISYAAILWIEKLTITEFFKRITGAFWNRSYEMGIQFLRWFLLLTFIGVVIATLTECQPFDHYWQVVPDPGPKCRQGYAQLLTMGSANIVTDLLLIAFPIPIILRSAMKAMRKFELILLFALSVIPIAITLYRIPAIINHQGRQQSRSLWASIEILFATAVTNALVLGSFVRDRGPKKMRFKFGSASDSLSRPSTRRDLGRMDACWGSDEDLVRGLGLNLDPELRGVETTQKPRPAPMAPPGRTTSSKPPAVDLTNAKWHFPSDDKSVSDMDMRAAEADRSPGACSILTPRKISFFDVGGLLEEMTPRQSASTPRTPDRKHSVQSYELSPDHCSASSRQDSHPALHDVGGLLSQGSPDLLKTDRRPAQSRPLSPSSPYNDSRVIRSALQGPPRTRHGSVDSEVTLARSTTPASLQDVGGLLRSEPQTASRHAHPPTYITRPPPAYRPHEHPILERTSLQDVGGLLNREIPHLDHLHPDRDSAPSALSIDPGGRAVSPLTTLDTNTRLLSHTPTSHPASNNRDITSYPHQYHALT